ncbi:MAG: DUF4397 domain-containing protein [Bacteroidetes bacterium]|nr:DUF4397 domain-containing protein [Bacteroidota bacterium]MBU1373145.1 DUF4397 domain-containing protein [Bacteroidota bacterium]MBU1484327.1 DUF4397 domain-containing protein [Bacteroidota bacterium]MBU1760190.1 DUF4397 domain-containing protein [Bacteroidota bacterium]MBU2266806.1 DUF4397 domain-containing protein [Bacteroidota bacterium]
MKITYKIWSIIFSISIIISACDKNEIKPTQEIVTNKTRITVVNALPGSPNLDVLVNDVKINGSTIAFISRFPLTEYSLSSPGSLTVKAVVNTPATIPTTAPNIAYGNVLSTNASTFEADKYYSIFVVGSPGATISGLLIEDKIPVQTAGKAFIRFVNAMPDGTAMDFYSGVIPDGAVNPTSSTAIFSNVAKGTSKDFIAIDATAVGTPYQFQLKSTGTNTNVGSSINLTAVAGKAYTYFSRGFNATYTIPGFTPARTVAAAPGLTLIVNR